MNKSILTITSSILLSALAAYGIATAANSKTSSPAAVSDNGQTVNLSLSDYPDFTYAAENSVEAVVYVKVTVKTTQQYIDPFSFFSPFSFGEPRTLEREQQGSGSGVIIREDGYIVTNNHVVAGAVKVDVTLNNNKTYEAKIIGTDPVTDVALIKIDETGLPCVKFADSDKLRLGEWVLAIGSPLGEQLRSTITAGIVSAKGRSMPNYDGEFKIESFIQTDAAVNPGNSGGALVNKAGELVGINTAIVSQTGAYSGYSFAVPSNIVSKVVGDLIDFGAVKRARLGIVMSPLTEKIAKEMKLSSLDGVYINEVSKESAAEKAGVKAGDVLLKIDSTPVKSPSGVQEKVNSYHPGDKATLTVVRGGKEMVLAVEFQGIEETTGSVDENGSVVFYGAKLKQVEGGVQIADAGNGKLARAGAESGFIIQYVNEQKVKKPQDVIEIAKKAKRSVFIEGITPTGQSFYFGFGKEE